VLKKLLVLLDYVLPRRTKLSGNASVCAVLFLGACASVLLYIAAHAGWIAFPPSHYVPDSTCELEQRAMLDHILK